MLVLERTAWSERLKTVFQSALVMLSLMAGTAFPFVAVSLSHYCCLIGNVREWANPFWGFVFGFGWFIAGIFTDNRSPLAQRFGGVFWPAAICIFLFICYGRLYDAKTTIRRRILVAIIVSFIVVLPATWAIFRYIPTWSETLQAVY
jgi:hypothetical protein